VPIVSFAIPRRPAGLALLAGAIVALGPASVPASAASGDLKRVCGRGIDASEVLTRAGSDSRCAQARGLMRAWRRADNPRLFRGFRCGEVPATIIRFHDDKRWFATWQCQSEDRQYRIWTRY